MPCLLPDDRLLAMLREGAPHGDVTTRGLGIGTRRGTATLLLTSAAFAPPPADIGVSVAAAAP